MKRPIMENRPKAIIKFETQDYVVETVGYIALAALWFFAFYSYNNSPDIVPIHFNFAGEADGFGDRQTMFITPVIATFMFFIMTVINSYPEMFNFPVIITPENAQRLYVLAIRMIRLLKIGVILVFLIVDLYTFASATGQEGEMGAFLLPAVSVVMFLPLIFYLVKALRTKK
ncbi:MAG: DUF1648 domain-containing protein [Flavobacterium sp.]|nr:MAG: DUF1648 domain-containing protein [Flavobacterium sp.]